MHTVFLGLFERNFQLAKEKQFLSHDYTNQFLSIKHLSNITTKLMMITFSKIFSLSSYKKKIIRFPDQVVSQNSLKMTQLDLY